ncbi:MAG: segregation/condensation protein A [Bacteroidota bacterium]|nr:segregation/condensation protein A [Bacteroidota bacterium]MDP4193306.1 segregation/condensation protein A [Bacteroidota bacterium]MDP4195607.1 segregation/condensation protein A [Bacteroidota bacterium]
MYKIRLQQFEGPLDLLLFFIKRDELNIYDIPISKITKDFFEYMNLIKSLDLEVAGDFILMATTLMQIKVRMLLPKEVDEKGDEIDPRADLIKALLEYKRYKEMSEELAFFESSQRKLSYRGNYSEDYKVAPSEFGVLLKNITLYDLMKAFKNALLDKPKEIVHEIKKIPVTIEEQINMITALVNEKKEVAFLTVVTGMDEKIRIIVTFIALLEMIKMGKIGLRESANFNDFVVYSLNNG